MASNQGFLPTNLAGAFGVGYGFGGQRPRFRAALAIELLTVFAGPVVHGDMHAQRPEEVWELAARPFIEVGGATGAPSGELFTAIRGAVRLADGRFVVADRRELRLTIVDRDGMVERTLGGRGQGPGEFLSVAGVWHVGGDTIGVWDPRALRITRLRADGEVVGTVTPISASVEGFVPNGSLDMFLGAFENGRVGLAWLVATRKAQRSVSADRMIFGVFDSGGRLERVIGEAPGMIRHYSPAGGGPIVFSPFPWAAIVRDSLVYTDGLHGEIQFFGSRGSTAVAARAISVPVDLIRLADAWKAFDEAYSETDGRSPIATMMARMNDRSFGSVPHYARMFSDGDRLWLKEYDPRADARPLPGGVFRTGGTWRIVETDGSEVARLGMPSDVAPLSVYGDELLGVARDSFHVERFVVYRILK